MGSGCEETVQSTDKPDGGLCDDCRNRKVVVTDRGSVFYRCLLAEQDGRFPKYPRLPVLVCTGWRPGADSNVSE